MEQYKNTEEINAIPFNIIKYNENGDKYMFTTTDESKDILRASIVIGGDTKEEAIRKGTDVVHHIIDRYYKRSNELNRWKPFQKGDWKQSGGRWVIIFGFKFYFRYGQYMEGGRYIPFTKLNISFTNYWTLK